MSDIKPGECHGARDFIFPDLHGRQLTIEAAREVPANLLDGLFDDVVIVEEPFGCGRDCCPVFDVGGGRPVDSKDLPLILLVARKEVESEKRRQFIGTVAGERRCAFVQFFVREICGADRIVVIEIGRASCRERVLGLV